MTVMGSYQFRAKIEQCDVEVGRFFTKNGQGSLNVAVFMIAVPSSTVKYWILALAIHFGCEEIKFIKYGTCLLNPSHS